MHLFLYEWITGGGLVEQQGALPKSLLTEGKSMLSALSADFLALEGCQVTVLRDMRLVDLPVSGCKVVDIHSNQDHDEAVSRLAAKADYTLIIAPEFDHLLLHRVKQVLAVGGQLLSAGENFVTLASNKSRTSACLATKGVPVPHAVALAADELKLPVDFKYPGVLKPVHGAGSQHTLLVAGPKDEPPTYPWPLLLEEYHPGIPASVSFLCGPSGSYPLAPFRQNLSTDGRFTYLGGSLLLEPNLVDRATRLATQAVQAMPMPYGYLGVDLLLGQSPAGEEDVVLEINPRLTTSYLGLREATSSNLAGAMLEVAAGGKPLLSFQEEPLHFTVGLG